MTFWPWNIRDGGALAGIAPTNLRPDGVDLLPPGADMDVDGLQDTRPEIHEFVRHVGRPVNDAADGMKRPGGGSMTFKDAHFQGRLTGSWQSLRS